MKIKQLTPMLWTEDLEATITFYTTLLGFKCEEQNNDWQWASLHKDGINLMVAIANQQIPYDKIVF